MADTAVGADPAARSDLPAWAASDGGNAYHVTVDFLSCTGVGLPAGARSPLRPHARHVADDPRWHTGAGCGDRVRNGFL